MKRLVIFALAFILYACPALAQSDPGLPGASPYKPVKAKAGHRSPHVEIWLPPDFRKAEGPWPLIIFSHGLGGCAEQAAFLTEYLAENGYIVAAPDHDDARPCKNARATESQAGSLEPRFEQPFREPEIWSEETGKGRRDDILFTLDSLLEDPQFKGSVDETKIGLAGHSLGAYASLGLSGAWPSWKDERFRAVLAMAPFTAPFTIRRSLPGLDVPVFYQTGSRDAAPTQFLKQRRGAYAQTSPPKYLMELDGAGPDSWTGKDPRFHALIGETALAFFNKYLKEESREILSAKKPKAVLTYWHQDGP